MDVQYDPIQKHFETGLNLGLLEIWPDIFKETIDELLTSSQSELWYDFATRIGEALNRNNEIMKSISKK